MNRFGCSDEKAIWFTEIENNLKLQRKASIANVIEEKPVEEEDEDDYGEEEEEEEKNQDEIKNMRRLKTIKILYKAKEINESRNTTPTNLHLDKRFSKVTPS